MVPAVIAVVLFSIEFSVVLTADWSCTVLFPDEHPDKRLVETVKITAIVTIRCYSFLFFDFVLM